MSEISKNLILSSTISSDDEAGMVNSGDFVSISIVPDEHDKKDEKDPKQANEVTRIKRYKSVIKGNFEYFKKGCTDSGKYVFARFTPLHGRLALKKIKELGIDGTAVGSVIYLYLTYEPPLSLSFASASIT